VYLSETYFLCRYTIIDEADEMLHSDWETELGKIMSGGGMSKVFLSTLILTNFS
jgi:hypothetical protein